MLLMRGYVHRIKSYGKFYLSFMVFLLQDVAHSSNLLEFYFIGFTVQPNKVCLYFIICMTLKLITFYTLYNVYICDSFQCISLHGHRI